MEAQIYEYYTTDPQATYSYNIDLVTDNFCFGVSANKKSQETDDELIEYFKLLISQGFTPYSYSPEMSTMDTFVFSKYYGGKYCYTSFSKDFTYKYEWNSAKNSKKKYQLIRKVECDVYYVSNGNATNGFQAKSHKNIERGTFSDSQSQSNTNTRKQSLRHTCNLCKGRKRIVKDTYPSLHGQSDYRVKCNECGGYFMRSTGHTHITCPQCHGKGYFTTD